MNSYSQKQHTCILDYPDIYNLISKDKLYGMLCKEPYNSYHYNVQLQTVYLQNQHKNHTFYSFTVYVLFTE